MLKCLLAPAAFLYKAGVTFRHRLFDWGILKSEKFDIPIICIGNITVGGTGKTPMAEMVIAYMSQMHQCGAALAAATDAARRGILKFRPESHYRDAGDEPLQIKLKFPDTVVAVCEKRSEGIRRHLRRSIPRSISIVMDDGFQHRYVEPKINIVMIDATRPVQHDQDAARGDAAGPSGGVAPRPLFRSHEMPRADGPDRPPHSAQGVDPGGLPAGLFHAFREFHAPASLCRGGVRRAAGAGAAGDRPFGHRQPEALRADAPRTLRGRGRDDDASTTTMSTKSAT